MLTVKVWGFGKWLNVRLADWSIWAEYHSRFNFFVDGKLSGQLF